MYTAPEVWDGAQADRRADIYSLGVVLWQLLTGRRLEDVRVSGANRAPAPSAHNPEVPARLDARRRARPGARPGPAFQAAGELQEALRPFLPTEFLPEPALAELLARHFDVARERRMLASEVERARLFLEARRNQSRLVGTGGSQRASACSADGARVRASHDSGADQWAPPEDHRRDRRRGPVRGRGHRRSAAPRPGRSPRRIPAHRRHASRRGRSRRAIAASRRRASGPRAGRRR